MPWIIAIIGWFIVIIFGSVTWRNYRRSHYANVTLRRPEMVTIVHHDARVEQYLRIDVFSHGADVYDLEIILEALYPQPDQPPHLMTAKLKFVPEAPFQNPVRKNQHVRFRLDHEKLKEYPYNPKDRLQRLELCKLRPGTVKIVAYQSGNRPIASLPGGDFEQALAHFDRAPHITVERRGNETVTTMRYRDDPTVEITAGSVTGVDDR